MITVRKETQFNAFWPLFMCSCTAELSVKLPPCHGESSQFINRTTPLHAAYVTQLKLHSIYRVGGLEW